MKVTRRTFLKTITAGTFLVSTGIGLSDIFAHNQTVFKNASWCINTKTKVISYIGEPQAVFDLLDVHRYINEIFESPPLMHKAIPIYRPANQFFEMANGWEMDINAMEHLTNGTLFNPESGDIWTNISAFPDNSQNRMKYKIERRLFCGSGYAEINAENFQ